jgi:LCP family protein required for cell wall assembly
VPDPGDEPQYTRYRARPRLPRRGAEDLTPLQELRGEDRAVDGAQPEYARYGRGRPERPLRPRRRVAVPGWRRALGWGALLTGAWIALSVLAFLVSATLQQTSFGGTRLDGGGSPPFSATTILVLGTDTRPKGSKEPGAATQGPARADTIMLLRVGGGHNAKLSIPRDTAVDVPGHGRQKINAAYAFGGTSLMVDTVRTFLGIDVDHVVEISFENFPKLIDAMGGIDYTGSCVVGRINGGARNGGVTVRLHSGTTHIDGKHALALARVRKNLCNPREDDLSRARRQQKILSAMKSRALSLNGLIRGPFIGWNAPRAIRTDMAGPTLLGVGAALGTSGAADPRVLRPTGGEQLPDGGLALTVSDAARQRAVRRFIDG